MKCLLSVEDILPLNALVIFLFRRLLSSKLLSYNFLDFFKTIFPPFEMDLWCFRKSFPPGLLRKCFVTVNSVSLFYDLWLSDFYINPLYLFGYFHLDFFPYGIQVSPQIYILLVFLRGRRKFVCHWQYHCLLKLLFIFDSTLLCLVRVVSLLQSIYIFHLFRHLT